MRRQFGQCLGDALRFFPALDLSPPNVPVVGHQAAKLEPRQRRDFLGQFHAGRSRLEPAAAEPRVKLHEHSEGGAKIANHITLFSHAVGISRLQNDIV